MKMHNPCHNIRIDESILYNIDFCMKCYGMGESTLTV